MKISLRNGGFLLGNTFMYKIKLVMDRGDGNTPKDGLLIEGWDWATPEVIGNRNNYNTIAHDVFEHIGKQTGSVEDELRAFGAIIFGRHNLGITGIGERFLGVEIAGFLSPDIKRIKRPKIHSDILDISDALCEGIEEGFSYTYPQEDFAALKTHVLHWLSKGYRQAERKYKYSSTLVNMFMELQRQLRERITSDSWIKYVTAHYDPKTEYVNVLVVEYE